MLMFDARIAFVIITSWGVEVCGEMQHRLGQTDKGLAGEAAGDFESRRLFAQGPARFETFGPDGHLDAERFWTELHAIT